jgi:prevent-host-death family protein
MTTITAEKARNSFSDLISHTAYSKDRVVVTRNGKRMAAIVSIEDLELLEHLMDRIEDELDLEDIRVALREYEEGKTIPWEQAKRQLGL